MGRWRRGYMHMHVDMHTNLLRHQQGEERPHRRGTLGQRLVRGARRTLVTAAAALPTATLAAAGVILLAGAAGLVARRREEVLCHVSTVASPKSCSLRVTSSRCSGGSTRWHSCADAPGVSAGEALSSAFARSIPAIAGWRASRGPVPLGCGSTPARHFASSRMRSGLPGRFCSASGDVPAGTSM